MRKISILIFCFITIISFAQNDKITDLEKISLALPDTIFVDRDFYFQRDFRDLFWIQFKESKFEKIESSQNKIIGKLDLFFDNDTITWEAFISEDYNLLRVMMSRPDAIPTIEIKIFQDNPKIIGLSFKYYNSVN